MRNRVEARAEWRDSKSLKNVINSLLLKLEKKMERRKVLKYFIPRPVAFRSNTKGQRRVVFIRPIRLKNRET